jgi:hypothetical protein
MLLRQLITCPAEDIAGAAVAYTRFSRLSEHFSTLRKLRLPHVTTRAFGPRGYPVLHAPEKLPPLRPHRHTK